MKIPFYDQLIDLTPRYGVMQAWVYETIVAPSVFATRAFLDDAFLRFLPRGGRVLDVGAGGGKLTLYVAEQRPDLTVTGHDLSPQQVARGRRAAAKLGDRVSFVEGSALALPFAEAAFDGVLCCGSIKHWPDRSRGVAECVRVLAPGGRLLLTEADRSCTHEDASAFVAEWPVPAPLEPVFLALFRTWVCGQSIDLDDARRFAAEVGLARAEVGRVPRAPLVMLSGFRAGGPSATTST